MKIKTPLIDVDRKRIREMAETGQNVAFLLNQRIIKGERFDNCIINGLLISGEDMTDTRFFGCKISMTANKTNFSKSIFRNCMLRGEANYANFDECDFKGSDLSLLKFKHAIMTRANLCGMKVSLFTPNLFKVKVSKKMMEKLFELMFDMRDDGFEPPAHMLR